MADGTGISWTDATWNPVRGCSRVSEGCRHCYAETIAGRFSGVGQPYEGLAIRRGGHGKWTGEVRFVVEHLADPLRWRKPRRIFVNSMSDLFHEQLTNEQIAAVFGVMAVAPQHTFQILTKRASRMREWFDWAGDPHSSTPTPRNRCHYAAAERIDMKDRGFVSEWPLPNVWLGVSVENQDASHRIIDLLATPAAVRFISAEPLLGPIDFAAASPNARSLVEDLDWVIVGCESGRGARPCDVAWLRSLREQCASARVPLFLKQAIHGAVFVAGPGDGHCGISISTGSHRKAGGVIELPYLDGVQHAAFPEKLRPPNPYDHGRAIGSPNCAARGE